MTITIHQRVASARARTNPTVVCRLPSGWVVLCDMQHLPGYSILLPDPVVESLNVLNRTQRAAYLCDMALVGDALLEVTGAYRVNYAILCNTDPVLHAHIVPRFLTEPDENRRMPPWLYSREVMDSRMFDYERDKELIQRIAAAIQKRL